MKSSIKIKDKIEADKVIKISPFKKKIRITTPHIHNDYFEIVYLTAGSGFHSIDSQTYEVKPPVIFIVRKEQIHYWELDTEPDGYVIIIKKRFVELSLDKEIRTLLYKLSKTAVIYLKDTITINHLFRLLAEESTLETSTSSTVVEGLLKALLAKLLQQNIPFSETKNIGKGYYHAYRELLSQEINLKNNVAYYAAQLNTSPQNLNAACRNAGSLSAANVLSEFMISEAKRLLIYTDNTVTQIAFLLSFNDTSHFVKYFKRFTSCTPQAFRIEKF